MLKRQYYCSDSIYFFKTKIITIIEIIFYKCLLYARVYKNRNSWTERV